MPEDALGFAAKIFGPVTDARHLRTRLEHIEEHLRKLPGLLRVQLDESGAGTGLAADGATNLGGGDPGGGGSPESTSNPLLDADHHEDTAAATPVAGDLIYADAAALWDRLGIGNEGDVNTVVSGLPAWAAPSVPTPGSSLAPLGAWARDSIQSVGTSGDGDEMFNTWAKGANDTIQNGMPAAGSVAYLTIDTAGDMGDAGDVVTAKLYKNGSATALTVTLTGDAGTVMHARSSGSPISFAQGDTLTIYCVKSGSPKNTPGHVIPWGSFS